MEMFTSVIGDVRAAGPPRAVAAPGAPQAASGHVAERRCGAPVLALVGKALALMPPDADVQIRGVSSLASVNDTGRHGLQPGLLSH